MTTLDPTTLAWQKGDGLIPAVVQHTDSGEVLMVAWMSPEALALSLADGVATFYSRSRARLWRKGETSGNTIAITSITTDCDRDTLLVRGRPAGPVCHTGATTCFAETDATTDSSFLHTLERIIDERIATPEAGSYTAATHARGTARMAQKVGEEGLEVALAAVQGDRAGLVSESADLLFHLLLLLRSQNLSLSDVSTELHRRHDQRRVAQ